MANLQLPPDFRDFLRLLNDHEVRYLLVGGYAVAYHGYPRTTLDMDIWIANHDKDAARMVQVMSSFGFPASLSPQIFRSDSNIVRMGVPPMRLEIIMSALGVEFDGCYSRRVVDTIDEVQVHIISLRDLRANKAASGRHKDLNDLEYLPEV